MIITVSEKPLSEMTRREKVELLQYLIKDLAEGVEGIEKTEAVCGGSARIKNTRIPIWLLENARRQGITEAELLQDYPSLTAKDLANAWDYVNFHKAEIELEIRENIKV